MGIKMAMEERKSLLERFSFSDNSLIKSRLGSCVIAENGLNQYVARNSFDQIKVFKKLEGRSEKIKINWMDDNVVICNGAIISTMSQQEGVSFLVILIRVHFRPPSL